MNEPNYDRELTDDQIYHSLFQYLKGNIDHQIHLNYNSFQYFLESKGLIKDNDTNHFRGPSDKRILKEGDYIRAQEFFFELILKGILVPITSKTNQQTFRVVDSSVVVKSTKGVEYFSMEEPLPYSEFNEAYQNAVSEDEILISQHERKLNEAVNFYNFIKNSLNNREDLKVDDVDFISKRYFEKYFPLI